MYQAIEQLRRRLNDRNVWDRQRVIFCIIAENSRRQLVSPIWRDQMLLRRVLPGSTSSTISKASFQNGT